MQEITQAWLRLDVTLQCLFGLLKYNASSIFRTRDCAMSWDALLFSFYGLRLILRAQDVVKDMKGIFRVELRMGELKGDFI